MRLRLLLLALLLPGICAAAQTQVTVGSKRFTESYILGEIVARTAATVPTTRVVHQPGMGNTGILFQALRSGAIDLYPEYTGTIAFELLGGAVAPTLDRINEALAPIGLVAGVPLGFDNGYALAMREEQAAALGITRLSDLAAHPRLRLGLSQEFLGRRDGWPHLAQVYGLAAKPMGLDHGLAYEALAGKRIDVIDLYTTDAKQIRYRLRVLEDDRGAFPPYEAVLLMRADLAARAPDVVRAVQGLAGRLDAAAMTRLNAAAELDGLSFGAVAARFLGAEEAPAARAGFVERLFAPDLARLTREHLVLVLASLAAAVAAGVPLGVLAARAPATGRIVLGSVAVLQTIPALALFAFLIPVMAGIGTAPALVALFLYSLLPIVRNTHAGIGGVPRGLAESALALGLPGFQRLARVDLPLAARSILAGIKTAAVINVGTATIAAFIGAGGYGERIAAGLALNDHAMLLAGAVPAAAMALAVQGLFDLLDRRLLARGL